MRSITIKIAILWGCLLCFGTVSAAPLSPQQALRLAQSFLASRGKMVSGHHVAKAPRAAEIPTEVLW